MSSIGALNACALSVPIGAFNDFAKTGRLAFVGRPGFAVTLQD
jgi:hypothetical protein